MENENKKKYFLSLNSNNSTEFNKNKIEPKTKIKGKVKKTKLKSKVKKPKVKKTKLKNEPKLKIKTKVLELPQSIPIGPLTTYQTQIKQGIKEKRKYVRKVKEPIKEPIKEVIKEPVKEKRKYVRKVKEPIKEPIKEVIKEPVKEKRKYVRKVKETQEAQQVKPKIIDILNKQTTETVREGIINNELIKEPVKKEPVKKEPIKKEIIAEDIPIIEEPIIKEVKPKKKPLKDIIIEEIKKEVIAEDIPIIEEVKSKRKYTKKPINENVEEIIINPEEIIYNNKPNEVINDGFLNNTSLVNSNIKLPEIEYLEENDEPIREIDKYIGVNNNFMNNNELVENISYKKIIDDSINSDKNVFNKDNTSNKKKIEKKGIPWAYDERNWERKKNLESYKRLVDEGAEYFTMDEYNEYKNFYDNVPIEKRYIPWEYDKKNWERDRNLDIYKRIMDSGQEDFTMDQYNEYKQFYDNIPNENSNLLNNESSSSSSYNFENEPQDIPLIEIMNETNIEPSIEPTIEPTIEQINEEINNKIEEQTNEIIQTPKKKKGRPKKISTI
jgi:hypothetical protein